ncbi:MAG: SulP family inorganic anion transporter [Nannocystaceae bacterium]
MPGSTRSADLRAGTVVFLVALPLCLGIATASGAPPFAGIVAGIVGGIVVGLASGSSLSVAGPAAGLTVIVADGILTHGFAGFLSATILAGAIQVGMGALGLGRLAHFVPNAVIRGMLAAIGLILVLKQLPHAVGYDQDFEGDFGFGQPDGHNTFTELLYSLDALQAGAIAVTIFGFAVYYGWRDYGRLKLTKYLPPHLMVVVLGGAMAALLGASEWAIEATHFVDVPIPRESGGLIGLWEPPSLDAFTDPAIWQTAGILAAVASIESLLSVEATDRLDPFHRITPTNRELRAQGLGNMVSGLLGGLPLTAVIVRSYANLQAGARSRLSAVIHGFFLAIVTLTLARLINHIPLAALAVILLIVGGKLTAPKIYREMWQKGPSHFLPFVATVALILLTDLLTGTLLGLAIGLFFVLRTNYHTGILVTADGPNRHLSMGTSVSFLNKGRLKEIFEAVPAGGHVVVDSTQSRFIDDDILDTIADFESLARSRRITVELRRAGGHTLTNHADD